jgi:hypothetical protein
MESTRVVGTRDALPYQDGVLRQKMRKSYSSQGIAIS